MNPLLDFTGLPRYSDIQPEHVTPAVDALLAENRALIDRLAADAGTPTWDSFAAPLEDANERLSRAWGQVSHLHSVMDSPELREAYNANLPKITQYYADLGQNEALYARFKALAAAPDFGAQPAARRKVIENEVRDFRLGGAELPATQKARFKAIQEELAALTTKFEENLLDATNDFALYVDDGGDLAGIPEDALQAAKEAAEKDGKAGWKFTLRMPSYLPVMQYGDNRDLRESLYRAYVTRASEFGNPDWDNTPLMGQILRLRREAARMLGFANYGEESLATKMAESPAQVLDFLHQLAAKAKPYAQRDLEELQAFAGSELGMDALEAWDIAYASEKLRLARYAFSDQEVKQYFPEDVVLPGMFKLVETLYGLVIEPADAPVWHQDVRFFSLRDRQGQAVGQFYVDLYARESKRGGAWMDDAITRRKNGDDIQTPVAYLNCNFSAPVGNKPALFTHDEVITLFHEFGHGLHHLLTQVEELGVSGINGVEWDAVELPSQFMENFCWEWDVLKHMTAHVDTGAALPQSAVRQDARRQELPERHADACASWSSPCSTCCCMTDFDPDGDRTPLQLLDEVRQEVAVVIPPAYNRFPNNFSHIFAGGYGAGYYSYKWAEVLSADAYSLFEENGVLNPEIGHRFWSEILGQGGSRNALESFVAFRGREPTIDALLRHSGMD